MAPIALGIDIFYLALIKINIPRKSSKYRRGTVNRLYRKSDAYCGHTTLAFFQCI